MKNKLIYLFLTLLLSLSIVVTPVSAYNMEEARNAIADLEVKVNECIEQKDLCHQMAECARALGYSEDSVIILAAKEKWNQLNDQQKEYESQLAEYSKLLPPPTTWTGSRLTRSKGVNYGPVGKETYYNLNMSGVVSMMRHRGYDAENYPYWVRNDGCKMLGPYIMLAANLSHYSRGSIVECSLGWGIVCDTGHLGWNHLDIAVTW